MNVTVLPSCANGTAAAPPSKSMAHRLLLCAGLAEGTSTVRNVAFSQDVLATLDCLRAMGAAVTVNGDTVTVTGRSPCLRDREVVLPCRECGSTLRFMIPLCMLSSLPARLTGSETLFSRPLTVYADLAARLGLPFARDAASLTVQGLLTAGEYEVTGNVSSQFVSGLLFALPLLSGDSVLRLIPPVESRPYIDLTLQALASFGVKVRADETEFFIAGGQIYCPRDVTVEGDYSNAAFLFALDPSGKNVTVTGLNADSLQGDRVCVDALRKLERGFCTIDLSDCPDLGPILFVAAATAHGARFTGTKRLRFKESDRAAAMAEELRKCGVGVELTDDTVTVTGTPHPPSEPLSGHNDHRIVMALTVLLTRLGGTVTGAEAVNKSDPSFFERIKQLGIKVERNGMDS